MQEAPKSEWEKVRASLKKERVAAQSVLRGGRDDEWLRSREAFRQDRGNEKDRGGSAEGTSEAGAPLPCSVGRKMGHSVA